MGKKKPAPLAFCFGDPEPVLSGAVYEYLGVWLLDNGRYYATPVPWSGLARLLRANAYHGPILEFKTNMAMRGFRASAALTRRDMHAVATEGAGQIRAPAPFRAVPRVRAGGGAAPEKL